MCTLFSLCLGYVKAKSSANMLLQPKNVLQQNKDKRTTWIFFLSLWIELQCSKHWHWHRWGGSQLLPHSPAATRNFAVHGSLCYPHVQINISSVTQHFFGGSHTFFFLCSVLHLLPCFHLFPPPVLPSESSSVMSHCVLLSRRLSLLSLLSCVFVLCLTENFSSWVFHGAAAHILEQKVDCLFSDGESVRQERDCQMSPTLLENSWTVYSMFCTWEGKPWRKEITS